MPKKSKTTVLDPRIPLPRKTAAKKTSEDPEIDAGSSPHSHVSWRSLEWRPLQRRSPDTSTAGRIGVTIPLPFEADDEDLPEILECFGGPAKVGTAVKQPHDHSKRLAFSLHHREPVSAVAGIQPTILSTKSAVNSFILRLTLTQPEESQTSQQRRAKVQQSAVERALGTPLRPLPPILKTVNFLFSIKTIFEFDKLFDFGLCPATVSDRTSADPQSIQLTSLLPFLLPSYPAPVPPGDPNDYLYFPALKFTNQTSTAGHDCIPSLYTDSLASHEKTVTRVRRAHARAVKWAPNQILEVPGAYPGALKNLTDKVPRDVRERAKEMFREQPVWMRQQFYENLKKLEKKKFLNEHKRFILPALAFKFSNGPWSHLWCRFATEDSPAYDPTKTSDARQYQVLDYRINQALFRSKRTVSKKHNPSERETVIKKLVEKIKTAQKTTQKTAQKTNNIFANSFKGFHFLILLKNLVDIQSIQRILESSEHHEEKICDFQEGFFKKGTMELLRLEFSLALLREDPLLVLKNQNVVRQFQNVGMFKNVVLPPEAEELEEEVEELEEGEGTEEMEGVEEVEGGAEGAEDVEGVGEETAETEVGDVEGVGDVGDVEDVKMEDGTEGGEGIDLPEEDGAAPSVD